MFPDVRASTIFRSKDQRLEILAVVLGLSLSILLAACGGGMSSCGGGGSGYQVDGVPGTMACGGGSTPTGGTAGTTAVDPSNPGALSASVGFTLNNYPLNIKSASDIPTGATAITWTGLTTPTSVTGGTTVSFTINETSPTGTFFMFCGIVGGTTSFNYAISNIYSYGEALNGPNTLKVAFPPFSPTGHTFQIHCSGQTTASGAATTDLISATITGN